MNNFEQVWGEPKATPESTSSSEVRISSPEEILPFLMPPETPYDVSNIGGDDPLFFTMYAFKQLSSGLIGPSATIAKNQIVTLDGAHRDSDESLRDVFRIRLASTDKSFAFHSRVWQDHLAQKLDNNTDYNNFQKALAEGIFAYLFSDAEAIKQSKELIAQVQDVVRKRLRRIIQNIT